LFALLIPIVAAAILILNRPRAASELSASYTATVPPTATASSLAATASAEGDQRLAPTITDRAAAGEQAALQGLSSRPPDERRAEETLALAKGARIAKQRELEEYAQKLRAQPDLLRDRAELTRLRGYIDDGDTTVEALALLAQLPGPLAPDLLYNTWTNSRQRPETAKLAEGLLMSQEVGAKASPALKVLLDLQSAKECTEVLQILSRAKLYADQRSVASLKKLNSRRGCGDQKLDDCYACLRKLEADPKAPSVNQVLIAARGRPAPALP
jgi:hypothetical protein